MHTKLKSWRIRIFMCLLALIAGVNVYYYWPMAWVQWAKFYTRDQDVIISFTTTPYRIDKLQDTLTCLSNQTFKPRQIYLSIPHRFKRDDSEYIIPEWMQNYPNLTILRTEDYGPATKLLGALEKGEIKPNTILVTVDDDTCYPPHTVLQLATRAKRYPQAALGYSGVELFFGGNKDGVKFIDFDNQPAKILEGWGAVAYRPHFFDQSIFEIASAPSYCYNSDDMFISFHLTKNHIPLRTVHTKIMTSGRVNQYIIGLYDDALHKMSHEQGKRYEQCCEYLQNKYPEVNFYKKTPGPSLASNKVEDKF
jgi:hypothetical protein